MTSGATTSKMNNSPSPGITLADENVTVLKQKLNQEVRKREDLQKELGLQVNKVKLKKVVTMC